MQIRVEIQGLDKVRQHLQELGGVKLKEATAAALNDTAYMLRREIQTEISHVFDRPTPYIKSSIRVKMASPERLSAEVGPEDFSGKTVDPAKVLAAQMRGGTRRDKRSEVALRKIGVLPSGYVTTIPEVPFPGSDDGRGNIRGAFMVQLLSYLQAFGEQGYRANMTQRRKDKLANVGRTESGYKTINGVQYFVSRGKHGPDRSRHLAPGVWARSGIHGSNVRPVLMFVRTPHYAVRLSLEKIARTGQAQSYFERRLRYRIRVAAGV